MIGYEVGSSSVMVYTMAKISLVEKLEAWMRKGHGCQPGNAFC